MCGVVGWVDFGRNLAREQSPMRWITGTMAMRGPDAEGLWLSDHVAFGHRRLAIIDLPGGGPARRASELALALDCWLRRYPVRLVVDA